MISNDSMHCYADDSTGDAQYIGHQSLSWNVVHERRSTLVSEIDNFEVSLCVGRISSNQPVEDTVLHIQCKEGPLYDGAAIPRSVPATFHE